MNKLENNSISKKLIEISKILTIHYFKNKHSNYPNIETEIQRINDISNNINFNFIASKNNQSTQAEHSSKDNSINYFVDENLDLSDISVLYPAAPSIIHELLHAISNENKEDGTLFVEEGMVSYVTANIIRYFISNPIKIEGINNEQFQNVLKTRDLTNAYIYPCEFASNVNMIMSLKNIDVQSEYIFHRNGLQRITELAKTFSDEFANILANQSKKNPVFSPNTSREYNYFFSNYTKDNINFNPDSLSATDIQMNKILINSYIQTGSIKKHPILIKRCLGLLDSSQVEKLLDIDSTNHSPSSEEIIQKVKHSLKSIKYNYKIYDSVSETSRQFENIISIYQKNIAEYSSLNYGNILAILIAYDMVQKHQPIDEILDVCDNYFLLASPILSDYRILINEVNTYYDNIKDCCENGQNLVDILNNKIFQACMFQIELPSPKDITLKNFWEQLDFIGKNTNKYFSENDVILYTPFYKFSSSISARYFSEDRVYTQKDYDIFSNKLNRIFKNSEYPIYMTHAGKSVDFIFIKNFVKYMNTNKEYFSNQVISLLHILKNNDLELGDDVSMKPKGNELPSLGENINFAYQKLKEENSIEKLEEFSSLLNELCIKDDKLFVLTVLTNNPHGKLEYIYDEYLIETLADLFGKDALKRYNIKFNDAPNLNDSDCR